MKPMKFIDWTEHAYLTEEQNQLLDIVTDVAFPFSWWGVPSLQLALHKCYWAKRQEIGMPPGRALLILKKLAAAYDQYIAEFEAQEKARKAPIRKKEVEATIDERIRTVAPFPRYIMDTTTDKALRDRIIDLTKAGNMSVKVFRGKNTLRYVRDLVALEHQPIVAALYEKWYKSRIGGSL